MTASEEVQPSQFGDDLDLFSDQAVRTLDTLARALHLKDAELEPALDAIVSTAVAAVDTAQHAGLILVVQGELIPQVTTGGPPQLLDELQQKLKEGPCIAAAVGQSLIRIDDMRDDGRWPGFAAEAMNVGVQSMLCVPLWVHERRLGTLSLYADHSTAFTGQHERVTHVFATLAAIALAEAQRTDQLRTALASRDVIGQAKGILMERNRVTADAAFGALSRASQNANLKLTQVARHLVETGELPGG